MRRVTTALLTTACINSGCLVHTTRTVKPQNDWPSAPQALGLPAKGAVTSVGAAAIEYIPPKPTSLAGFGSISRRLFPPVFGPDSSIAYCRKYQEIENPPRIKAAIANLSTNSVSSSSKVFFISLDTVAVTADLSLKIIDEINKLFGSGTAQLSNTFITATHTHSAPAGLTDSPLWSSFICDSFNESLLNDYLDKTRIALKQADAAALPINSIKIGNYNASGFLKSRAKNMPENLNVEVLSFVSETGDSPLAFLEMAVHPTTFGTKSLTLSADLVTPLENSFQTELGLSNVFLLQTEVGNMESQRGEKNTQEWAQSLAQEFKLNSTNQTTNNLEMYTYAELISLPQTSINWKGCDASAAQPFVSLPILNQLPKAAPVTKLNIGNQSRLFLPGEWTTSAAVKLMERLPEDTRAKLNTKIFSLAYDYTGYHIDKSSYDSVGIESCSSLYGKDGLDRILDAMAGVFINRNAEDEAKDSFSVLPSDGSLKSKQPD